MKTFSCKFPTPHWSEGDEGVGLAGERGVNVSHPKFSMKQGEILFRGIIKPVYVMVNGGEQYPCPVPHLFIPSS